MSWRAGSAFGTRQLRLGTGGCIWSGDRFLFRLFRAVGGFVLPAVRQSRQSAWYTPTAVPAAILVITKQAGLEGEGIMHIRLTHRKVFRRAGAVLAAALMTAGLIPATSASGAGRRRPPRAAPVSSTLQLDTGAGPVLGHWTRRRVQLALSGSLRHPWHQKRCLQDHWPVRAFDEQVFTAYDNLVDIPGADYVLNDSNIVPDPGSVNPFVPGTRVMAPNRNFTVYALAGRHTGAGGTEERRSVSDETGGAGAGRSPGPVEHGAAHVPHAAWVQPATGHAGSEDHCGVGREPEPASAMRPCYPGRSRCASAHLVSFHICVLGRHPAAAGAPHRQQDLFHASTGRLIPRA